MIVWMTFQKLVGNKVPDNMRRNKREPVESRVASKEEHLMHARMKLREETKEFLTAESMADMMKESGDLLEAIVTILGLKNITRGEVYTLVADKLPRIMLEEDELRTRLYNDANTLSNAEVAQDIVRLSVSVIRLLEDILEWHEKTLEDAFHAQQERLEERGGFDGGVLILMEKEGVGVFTPIL